MSSLLKVSVIERQQRAALSTVPLLHHFCIASSRPLGSMSRFGRAVKRREWFLVPLHAIDDGGRADQRPIRDYVYNLETAALTKRQATNSER